MTLADDLLPILPQLRSIAGQLGFRPFSVSIVVRDYNGGSALSGDSWTLQTITPILEDGYSPKVRWLNEADYLRGTHPDVTLEVGPITPTTSTGGYSFDDLEQIAASKNSQIFYLVKGAGMAPNGSLFSKVAFLGERTLGYKIQLKRADDE